MYHNYNEAIDYPFYATFFHLGVDESKPLDEQVEERVVSFESVCDVGEQDGSLTNDKIAVFMPFSPNNDKAIAIQFGESVEINSYGLIQKGRVLGVFPSQLGGIKVLCTRI